MNWRREFAGQVKFPSHSSQVHSNPNCAQPNRTRTRTAPLRSNHTPKTQNLLMRAAYRTAICSPLSRLLQPLLTPLGFRFSPLLPSTPPLSRSPSLRCCSSFDPPDPFLVPPPSPFPMEKQFEEFKLQLEESGGVREKIRGVVAEIEASNRMLSSCLLSVHQSLPLSGLSSCYS